jgi:hypothetical protein
MLNQVHVTGVVTRSWTYGSSRFVRIACLPDPGRTLKRSDAGSEPEHITLRFEGPLAIAARTLKSGAAVRADGYLTSRDYDIPLARFAETAKAADGAGAEAKKVLAALRKLADQAGEAIVKPHSLNEVVVENFVETTTAPSRGRRRKR